MIDPRLRGELDAIIASAYRPDVQPAVSAIMVALIETLARLIARVEVLERQVRGRRPHRRRRR